MANLPNRNRQIKMQNMNRLPHLMMAYQLANNQVRFLPNIPQPRQDALGPRNNIPVRQNVFGPQNNLFGPDNFDRIKWHNDLWNARSLNFGNFQN